MSDNTAPLDPELEGSPFNTGSGPLGSLAVLVLRAVGAVTLALFGLWWAGFVLGHTEAIGEAETSALAALSATFDGPTRGGPVAAAAVPVVVWVVICVLSALHLVYLVPVLVKKIVLEWKWVWKHLTSSSWWDKLFGVLGLVLVLVETVFWVVVTVATVVVVIINVATLVKVLL